MSPDHSPDRDALDWSTAGQHALSRRSFVAAAGAGIGGAALGGVGTAGAVGGETPPLETDGRWIVDPDGEPVKLRGFATAALEFIDYDWYPFTVEEVLERATDGEDWTPNTVRLPVGEEAVHEHGMDYVVNDLLRPAVDLLADRGVYAVIDFHLIRPYVDAMGNAEGMVEDGWAEDLDGLGFDATVPTDDLLIEFWSEVAPAFADDDNVLFELFNEPTLPVSWSSYGEYGDEVQSREDSWYLWRDAAQPWVDEIREHAPETPVIVGSPSWTSETQFAPEAPFEGENLIYASHIYPPNGLPNQTYEHDGETMEPFEPEYGEPAQEVPVICTEFGWDPDEPEDSEGHGTTSEWGEPMREWLESYDNMGWLAWCFDDTWAPTFFESPNEGVGQPWELKDGPEQSGWFVQEWLQETVGDGSGPSTPASPADQWTNEVTESTVELEWEPVANADSYVVYVDDEMVERTASTSYTLTGLDAGTTYTVGLAAENGAGESPIVEIDVTTAGEGECSGAAGGSEALSNGQTVCDVDGDGQYMDVTGDGSVTNSDVTEFFGNQHVDPWDSRTDLFDFDGDGDVSQADVVALFASV